MVSTKGQTPQHSVGGMLVEAALITGEQWQQVLETHGMSHPRAEQALVEQNLVTPQQLAFFTSLHLGIPYVNLNPAAN